MPEPSILFTVTGVVVVSLAAWLAIVLKKANEPWGRTANADMVVAKDADPPLEPAVEAAAKSDPKVEAAPKSDPKPSTTADEKSDEKAEAEVEKKKSDA